MFTLLSRPRSRTPFPTIIRTSVTIKKSYRLIRVADYSSRIGWTSMSRAIGITRQGRLAYIKRPQEPTWGSLNWSKIGQFKHQEENDCNRLKLIKHKTPELIMILINILFPYGNWWTLTHYSKNNFFKERSNHLAALVYAMPRVKRRTVAVLYSNSLG